MRKAFYFTLILFLPSLIFSVENEDDIIILPSSSVLNQDYFVYGKNIEILGTVNGNVYVFGGQVLIDGTINGNVLIVAGGVELSGKVSQNVWVLSGQVSVTGTVGKSIKGVSATIELYPRAHVGQSVILLAERVDLKSTIEQHARVYASTLRLSECIGGNLYAHVRSMRIASNAYIGGNVEYWSHKKALISSDAQIQGEISHHPSLFYHIFHGKIFKSLKIGSKLATLIMNFFYTFVIALIMMRYFPQCIEDTVEALNTKTFQAFIAGVILVFLLPLLFTLLLITIVGIPFAFTLLVINVISFYTVKILTITWISNYIFSKRNFDKHRCLYFIFGLIIYYFLTLIPYIGRVVAALTLLLGLGGLILGRIDRSKKKKINNY